MRFRLALILLGIAAALVPMPSDLVERRYATAVFPWVQRGMTALSNLTPMALIDGLLVAGSIWVLVQTVKMLFLGRREPWVRRLLRWAWRAACWACVVYLAFLAMWGLNYRRVPLTERVRFDPRAASPEAVVSLARRTVAEANRLYADGHSRAVTISWIGGPLADGFAAAQLAVGVAIPARPGRPKRSILDVYFQAAGVEGMTDPFFLETLVAGDLLPFERPFVIAHEWSHLAGFANEGEANFLGWLACTKGSDESRYSAALFLYSQLYASLSASERAALASQLDPGPRADLQAVADRVRRHVRPVVADAGWRVYDRYLKANRVEAGTRSYAEVVRLVLGVRLEPA